MARALTLSNGQTLSEPIVRANLKHLQKGGKEERVERLEAKEAKAAKMEAKAEKAVKAEGAGEEPA